MFVRTIWHLHRLFDVRGALREMDVRADRESDLLGLGGVDFSDMTDGQFDRRRRAAMHRMPGHK